MSEVDVTEYLAPYGTRRVHRPLRLRLTDDTYPLEARPEESWLPIAFRAFARLAERMLVRDALMLGTGNGLDALGAAEIFTLKSLAVTDLFEASLSVSRDNILAHLADADGIELSFHTGDLLTCVPPDRRFCLIYENLPNIPATPEIQLERGINTGRFFDAGGLDVPEPFGRYLLALHHRLLSDAQEYVRDGGGVLTALGGRIPHEVAFDLHRACGYRPDLLAFDVKRQVEPDLVIPPYARAEKENSVDFTFYAPEAIELVAEGGRAGLDGQALADAVAPELVSLAMTAREAEVHTRRGQPVAHSVLMIFGERDASEAVTEYRGPPT